MTILRTLFCFLWLKIKERKRRPSIWCETYLNFVQIVVALLFTWCYCRIYRDDWLSVCVCECVRCYLCVLIFFLPMSLTSNGIRFNRQNDHLKSTQIEMGAKSCLHMQTIKQRGKKYSISAKLIVRTILSFFTILIKTVRCDVILFRC